MVEIICRKKGRAAILIKAFVAPTWNGMSNVVNFLSEIKARRYLDDIKMILGRGARPNFAILVLLTLRGMRSIDR